MKPMMLAMAVAMVAMSGFARAETAPPTGASNPDVWDSSFQLEFNVFRQDAVISLNGISAALGVGVANGGPFFPRPVALVGYQFGENALLLGMGIFFQGSSTAVSLNPTYRHYLTPLQAGRFSGFVEGSVDILTLNPIGNNATLLGLGLSLGAGGEWLFIRNVGVIVKVLLGYAHESIPQTFGSSLNFDSFSIGGAAGLAVHL